MRQISRNPLDSGVRDYILLPGRRPGTCKPAPLGQSSTFLFLPGELACGCYGQSEDGRTQEKINA